MSENTSNTAPPRFALDGRRHAPPTVAWRVLRMAFWVYYDHVGLFLRLNAVTVIPLLVLLWFLSPWMHGVSAFVGLLFFGSATIVVIAGQVQVIGEILAGNSADWRAMALGMRRLAVPGFVLGALVALALSASAIGMGFYSRVVAAQYPLAGMTLVQICACTAIMVLMIAFHAMPALYTRDGAPLRALGTALVLVVNHPVVSALLLLPALAVGLAMATPPGVVILASWPLVALAACAHDLLMCYHTGVPVDGGTNMYLNRGLRDFLCPWKE